MNRLRHKIIALAVLIATGSAWALPDLVMTDIDFDVTESNEANNSEVESIEPGILFADGFEGSGGLIISEYVEGSSNNKAIELLNVNNDAVDLAASQCNLRYYGAPADTHTDATLQIDLVGTIQPNATFIVCQSNIAVFPTGQCDQLDGTPGWFNGDDPVELRCDNVSQDWLGQTGVDIDFAQNQTLRRKCSVSVGDTVGDDVFDSTMEWGQLPTDDVSGLGNHSPIFPATASSPKSLAIEAIDIVNQRIRLRNVSAGDVTVTSAWRLCNFPTYEGITGADIVIDAGASATFDIPEELGLSAGGVWGLGVYIDSNFNNADSMMDFLQVNGAGTFRENVAVTAGVWTAGEFIALDPVLDGGLVLKEGGSSDSAGSYETFNRVCALP
jgi:hypothetical protein